MWELSQPSSHALLCSPAQLAMHGQALALHGRQLRLAQQRIGLYLVLSFKQSRSAANPFYCIMTHQFAECAALVGLGHVLAARLSTCGSQIHSSVIRVCQVFRLSGVSQVTRSPGVTLVSLSVTSPAGLRRLAARSVQERNLS